ncbi:MAG TPA: hypothetical protein VIK59_12005 [Verrucomicrobiae bacterium]
MKNKLFSVSLFFLACVSTGQAQCSMTNVTLYVAPGAPTLTNASYNVQSGQIAKVIYAYVSGGEYSNPIGTGALQVSFSDHTNAAFVLLASTSSNSPASSNLPAIAGPATISVTRTVNTTAFAICTIEVSTPNTVSSSTFVPRTAVVIPADSGGSVNIILESSPDLINWYPSLPGSYGANYTNRFFRVVAQLAP